MLKAVPREGRRTRMEVDSTVVVLFEAKALLSNWTRMNA